MNISFKFAFTFKPIDAQEFLQKLSPGHKIILRITSELRIILQNICRRAIGSVLINFFLQIFFLNSKLKRTIRGGAAKKKFTKERFFSHHIFDGFELFLADWLISHSLDLIICEEAGPDMGISYGFRQ